MELTAFWIDDSVMNNLTGNGLILAENAIWENITNNCTDKSLDWALFRKANVSGITWLDIFSKDLMEGTVEEQQLFCSSYYTVKNGSESNWIHNRDLNEIFCERKSTTDIWIYKHMVKTTEKWKRDKEERDKKLMEKAFPRPTY